MPTLSLWDMHEANSVCACQYRGLLTKTPAAVDDLVEKMKPYLDIKPEQEAKFEEFKKRLDYFAGKRVTDHWCGARHQRIHHQRHTTSESAADLSR